MDNLDRMYRHLVRTIRSRFPQYLGQPFDVGELYQTILPYRHYRRELGLETNDDYEMTLTELLSGARDYLIVDDHMRDVLKKELGSTNPDPAAFKQFATLRVALSPAALRSLEAGPAMDPGTPDIAVPFSSSASDRPGAADGPAGGYDNSSSASPVRRGASATRACSFTHSRTAPARVGSTDCTAGLNAGDAEHATGRSKHRTFVWRSLRTRNGLDHTKCRRAV
jgi:hypothetical protein